MPLSKYLRGIMWIQSIFSGTNCLVVVKSGNLHSDYLHMNLSFCHLLAINALDKFTSVWSSFLIY